MDANALLPVKQLSDAELAGAVDALLARAARVSPPRDIVEATLQATALQQLARVRDELHRRSRARKTPSGEVSTGSGRTRQWIDHAAREDEIDALIDTLAEAQERAARNLIAGARDPANARVPITSLRESFTLRGVSASRFRKILIACERRSLIVVDGPFVEIAEGRSAGGRGAGAAHRALELTS